MPQGLRKKVWGGEGLKDPSEVSLERKTRQDRIAVDALGSEGR